MSEDMFLCCSDKHPLFSYEDGAITPEILAQTPTIHPGIDIDPKGKKQLKELNLMAKSYQFDTRKALIMSGKYIGYLPHNFIQQELANGVFTTLLPHRYQYQFNTSIVTKKHNRSTKKVELLKATFQRVFIDVERPINP